MKRLTKPLGKLVRDKIPEEIAREGRPFHKVDVVSGPKDLLLRRKLLEEVFELCKSPDLVSLKEELADVFEVLGALAFEHGISLEEIESIRITKRQARGGFDQGIFIDYVASPTADPEVGLFGPIDYVSVTRRTPKIREVRIDEKHLLRIPLTAALFNEQFRVGPYVVMYSDHEILVQIQDSQNEGQLSLFPIDKDWYDLQGSPADLRRGLTRFEGCWKIYGNILLKMFGFPVPDSIIVAKFTAETEKAVRDFCAARGFSGVLLRHDRCPEIPGAPRGGYLFFVHHLRSELEPFFAEQRIVMLQEPLSPFDDLYSCNAFFRKEVAHAFIEIVGPGFDASDLNRGDVTPHEQWELPCHPNSELTLAAAKKVFQVDKAGYEHAVRQRLAKIGKLVAGEFKLGAKKGERGRNEKELVKLARRVLRKQRKTLLLKHASSYCPISATDLEKFAKQLHHFRDLIEASNFMWKEEIGLSMSLLPSGRVVCWQVIWPERKFEGRVRAN